jgi:hypothetical protein
MPKDVINYLALDGRDWRKLWKGIWIAQVLLICFESICKMLEKGVVKIC